jgi:phage baseplate assembly protein W
MWSLAIRNGDLTLGGSSYGTVTGEDKLVQDLRCFILEKRGTDDMHPTYGTTLDGGRLDDGTESPGLIGKPNTALVQLEVESELKRIINDYQARQLERAKADRMAYGKTTLHRGEVLLGVTEMKFTPVGDTLNILITLQTANDTKIDLGLEV